jgi:hypothetical protein
MPGSSRGLVVKGKILKFTGFIEVYVGDSKRACLSVSYTIPVSELHRQSALSSCINASPPSRPIFIPSFSLWQATELPICMWPWLQSHYHLGPFYLSDCSGSHCLYVYYTYTCDDRIINQANPTFCTSGRQSYTYQKIVGFVVTFL